MLLIEPFPIPLTIGQGQNHFLPIERSLNFLHFITPYLLFDPHTETF